MNYNKILMGTTIGIFMLINGIQSEVLENKGNRFKLSSGYILADHPFFKNLVAEIPSFKSYNYIESSIKRGANWRNKLISHSPYSALTPFHQQIKPQDRHSSLTEQQVLQNCLNINAKDHRQLCHTQLPTQTSSPSTPSGINCRRVMNSVLNDLGEIIDSVAIVCDPPTTTPKPTRKTTVATTPRTTTTTKKPLVKVCGPVMDSYLNAKGEIIDSVTIVCEMKEVK